MFCIGYNLQPQTWLQYVRYEEYMKYMAAGITYI